MNYKLISTSVYRANQFVTTWHINETATNQIVASYEKQPDAKIHMRKLNLGNGFDGWTPAFILNKMAINFSKEA